MHNPIFKLIEAAKKAGKGGAAKASKNISSMFIPQVIKVIENLEGGYFHPDMLKDGRVKDSRYSSSGETMYGIDRKAGGTINDTPAGRRFWAVIDKANARKLWKWNYKGGDLAPVLLPLAADVMKPEVEKYIKLYLTQEAEAIVKQDTRLLFHFIYATWNGPGWFRAFANPINNAVQKGTTNPDALVKIAIQSRLNPAAVYPGRSKAAYSLIAQGGKKIEKLLTA
jgi:hypothetical protein